MHIHTLPHTHIHWPHCPLHWTWWIGPTPSLSCSNPAHTDPDSPIWSWDLFKLEIQCCCEQIQKWLMCWRGGQAPGMWLANVVGRLSLLRVECPDPPQWILWPVAALHDKHFITVRTTSAIILCHFLCGEFFLYFTVIKKSWLFE